MTKSLTTLLRIASWALLLFALAWTVWYLFAGFGNPMDPHYWLYKYSTLKGGWLSAGTILTGCMIVRLFGVELLPLRIAGWVCVAAAIALPYCILLTREQRRANIHWLALAYLLMQYGAFQEFSPGTLTVPLLAVLWVLLILYRRSEHFGLAIAMGVVAGIAVTVRMPNILALPVLLVAMGVEKDFKGQFEYRDRLLMLCSSAIAAGAVYMAGRMFLVPAPLDASMESHHLGAMINELWEKGALLAGALLFWGGAMAIGYAADRQWQGKWKNTWMIVCGLLAGGLLAYYVTFVPRRWQWYNIDITYIISAICVAMALITRRKELCWGTVLLAVAPMGTDTGWLKLFPVVLCLLPVAAVQYEPAIRRYLWPTIAVFGVSVMIRFSINSVGCSNLRESNCVSVSTPYEHIYLRQKDNRWLEQVKADYDSLYTGERQVLAFGQEMHMMRTVTGCQAARYNEFWSNIFDAVYTSKYRPIILRERPIVFCAFSPRFKTKPTYQDGHSALEEMLREEGYQEIDRTKYNYMIYIPNDSTNHDR